MFKEVGRGSKSWWLLLVREHGSEGGMTNLAALARLPYQRAKPVIDNLVLGGFIEMHSGPTASGKGKLYTYGLTAKGETHLEEEPGDISDLRRPEPEPTSAETSRTLQPSHPVPVATPYTGASEPNQKRMALNLVRTKDKPEIIPPAAMDVIVPPAANQETSPMTVQERDDKEELSDMVRGNEDIKALLMDLVREICYEKHGEEITANELIERL